MSSAAKKLSWNYNDVERVFGSFPLLKAFSKPMLSELAKASEIIEVPLNTEILKQGQLNEHLYFLIQGQVGVYVDHGRVSQMQSCGDMLGEMSVISGAPVTATILAEMPVTLVRINSRDFLESRGHEQDLYRSILFRIYATVLADRLHETNQKAKHFEDLNIKLSTAQSELEVANHTLERKVEERTLRLEQQNTELLASKNKLEELNNSKRVLFQKLSEFHTQFLTPLKTFLDDVRKRFPNEVSVNNARRVVFEVQQLLGPLTALYSSEQAMKSKHVLLADSNKKQQIVAKMALGGSGVVLDYVSTMAEGEEKIKSTNYDLVFVDPAMLELGNLARAKNPRVGLVLMTSDQVMSYLPALKQLQSTPHIVSRDEADRTFTVKNIMTTVTKLLGQDFFGLEKYLSWGVEVHARSIFSSKQRAALIDEVDAYFEKLGIRRSNRERMRGVVEELLMNAIYDAPTSPEGKAVYNHLQRTEDIVLKPEEQGMLRFATDGMLLAVSVQDPFGSLQGSTILRYLENNYSGMASDLNVKENKGGAGRGLHQIVENSDLVVFNIDPGKKTEVIALFNVEVKQAEHQNPSFHLFIKS